MKNALLCPWLALGNLKNNSRDYLPFLGTASLIVCLFFTVCNIAEAPGFGKHIPGGWMIQALMVAGTLLMGLSTKLLLGLAGIAVDYTPGITPRAVAITVGLFGVIFAGCLGGNLVHLSLAAPTQLLQEDHSREKDPRFGVLGCVLGVLLLGAGYSSAAFISSRD